MRFTCDAAIANVTELAAFVSKLSEAQVGKFDCPVKTGRRAAVRLKEPSCWLATKCWAGCHWCRIAWHCIRVVCLPIGRWLLLWLYLSLLGDKFLNDVTNNDRQ